MFEFESVEFTTQAKMNKEKKRLMDELCEFMGLERGQFRLQQGLITLYGLTKEGNWLPLTGYITEFGETIKRKGFVAYKIKTKLAIQK